MPLTVIGSCESFIRGVPDNPERPVLLPPGVEKARVRFRNHSWACIFYREGDSFVHRMLLDKGDHFEVSDFKTEQGRNRHV